MHRQGCQYVNAIRTTNNGGCWIGIVSGGAPEDGDGALLAQPPRTLARLDVCRWVPVWIEQDDTIRSGQIDAKTADSRREQKHEDVWIAVEVVDHAKPHGQRHGAVHAVVAQASVADVALDNVEHLLRLREEQRLVALLVPLVQHLHTSQLGVLEWAEAVASSRRRMVLQQHTQQQTQTGYYFHSSDVHM